MSRFWAALASMFLFLPAGCGELHPELAAQGTNTLHYAPNGNFDANGNFLLGPYGFNLADVSSLAVLNALPNGVRGLVFLGLCNGADATFQAAVTPYIGNPKRFGYYLFDDVWSGNPACNSASNLAAESDWVHANDPGAQVFIWLANGSSWATPSYGGYGPAETHADLFGIGPYPCRTERPSTDPCDFAEINRGVAAAQAAGIALGQIVPSFQAFAGGFSDDGGGTYLMPSVSQAYTMLATWAALTPRPVFDYTYSWGPQTGNLGLDTALSQTPSLQPVFQLHNAGGSP